MFPVTTKQSGTCLGVPDTCKVPAAPSPIPTPFPNTAMCNQVDPSTASMKVKVDNMNVLHIQSKIPMSTGDEAGSAGGVVSGTIKGEVKYTSSSMKVKVEGKAVVYVGCMTAHNGSSANCPGGAQIAPSQTKVIVTG
ncbi:MAG: DUF4150 domain-containing protein [Myxococcales bacterium]|nr:DUF4150 domain-containing protein [Myxococcales bacterium]